MDVMKTAVLVIGGGPGGYVSAIRAAQLGLDTLIVEETALGGTCLNVGCIPSKALIHAAQVFHDAVSRKDSSPFGVSISDATIDFARTMGWKDGIVSRLTGGVAGLLKKNKVKVIHGTAMIEDGKTCSVVTATGTMRVVAEHVVLATGSVPVEIKALPFGGPVLSSTDILALPAVPNELVVVGAGYIGLELGMAFAKLGSSVTMIEAAERIIPNWDRELTAPVAKRLETLGVRVMTNTSALGLADDGALLVRNAADGTTSAVRAEKILVAVGRRPRTDGFGLEKLDLDRDGPFVRIDDRCATSMRNVWAVGDLTGEPMLAHRAMAQGAMVAELIAGRARKFDKVAIPAVCFSDPEIVSVGLLPEEARKAGHPVVVSSFPFIANGRALSQADDAGFIRIVARSDNHRVLGIQAVGHDISELSSTFGLALEMGAALEDIAATVHAHPTRSEALQEAALGGLGYMLHL